MTKFAVLPLKRRLITSSGIISIFFIDNAILPMTQDPRRVLPQAVFGEFVQFALWYNYLLQAIHISRLL